MSCYCWGTVASNRERYGVGLKRIPVVSLLSGYPDANIYRDPTDSNIIKLAIHFEFITTSSAKYSSLSIYL